MSSLLNGADRFLVQKPLHDVVSFRKEIDGVMIDVALQWYASFLVLCPLKNFTLIKHNSTIHKQKTMFKEIVFQFVCIEW